MSRRPSASLMHQNCRANHQHTGLGGSIFNFNFTPRPPHLLPSSTKQAYLFSEGKMRSRWQLIEKQQFAFDKVFFENEYILRFEYLKNKK